MDTRLYTVDTPRKKSSRVTVTIHLTPGKDDDLIEVVRAIPMGQRMNVFKNVFRGVTAGKGASVLPIPQQQPLPMPMMPDHSEALKHLTDKIEWMERAVSDMPGYFENLIKEVAVAKPSRSTRASPPPPAPEPDRERASEDVLQQRDQRLKKASW